jgi:hypothetical protein
MKDLFDSYESEEADAMLAVSGLSRRGFKELNGG